MATSVYVQNTEAVTSETFDDDTVLINFLTGTYFSLRGSAPIIWSLLQSPVSLDEILSAISGDTDEARNAVQQMLDLLVAENCVQIAPAEETQGRAQGERIPVPYAAPVLDIFHDLQELIVVDPVHEVDEIDGWPHRPPPFPLE